MPELTFHYTVSKLHQEIKADGAFGGVAPTGDKIAMSIYTERNPIPQVVVQYVGPDGVLGDEIAEKRVGKTGIVRSVQTTIHMDVVQARSIHDWLAKRIEELEAMQKAVGKI